MDYTYNKCEKPIPLVDRYGTFTTDGCVFSDKIRKVLTPLIEQAVRAGYDIGHIKHIVESNIDFPLVCKASEIRVLDMRNGNINPRQYTEEELDDADRWWESYEL